MNLLTLDPSTMAGMTDEHFIASVEPLLMTPLERELFKRFYDISLSNDRLYILDHYGFDEAEELQKLMDAPECPSKDVLDESIENALYLRNMFANGTEGYEVADKLHTALESLQGELT